LFNRIRRAIIAIALISAALGGSAPVSAHTYLPWHYEAPCDTGHSSYNAQAYLERPDANHLTAGPFKGVKAEAQIAQLHVCTGFHLDVAYSLVNAVNFTAPGASGQFGYAQINCSGTGNCYGGWSESEPDFWWTSTDQSLTIQSADWVDFNSDGTHDHPQVGKKYEFSIEWIQTLNPPLATWKYCVKDLTGTFAGTTDCTAILRNTTSYMTQVWYGVEIWNDASAFGNNDNAGSSSVAKIGPLKYLNSSGSIYSTITDEDACTPAHGNWTVTGPYPAPDHWLSEHCDITGGTGTTYLSGWQAWHQ
jgi:hypothetical protein